MRTVKINQPLFYLLSLIFLSSCGGGGESADATTSDKDKTIEEMYADFKSSDDFKKSVEFGEKIQKIIEEESRMAMLPASTDGLSGVKLDFQKNLERFTKSLKRDKLD